MEAFEQFVALSLEHRGFVVSGPLKFPVTITTRKTTRHEDQTHGFEVDLVASRKDKLVLATVKSFFGSRGVVADQVTGSAAANTRLYAILNNELVRDSVIRGAAARFGYEIRDVELHFYVGRFATKANEQEIRQWCAKQVAGGGPIEVFGADAVVADVLSEAKNKQYRDNPVLATIKVLNAAKVISL